VRSGGFADLLAAGGDPLAAVLPAAGKLPDRLPVGGANGSLGVVTRLGEVLSGLLAGFDAVIIDAPPILLSADAEALVRAAGLTILVIEAESLPKAVVKRALRSLEKLEPRAMGAVVNRVRLLARGGYFSEALSEQSEGRRAEKPAWLSPWLWR
jgi:cellulose biosynthesis protein BcsQ